MSATAAAPAGRRATGALLLFMIVGVSALAVVQALRTGPTSDLVELHGQAAAKLSPFVDASGAPLSIDAFRGKTVILNLWAPWCVPCLEEMPSLDRLAARLPESAFAVVAVTSDRSGAGALKETFARMGLKRLKLYLDPEDRLAPAIGARGLPTTMIIGRDGRPLAYREGSADWDSDAMATKLEALAGRAKGPD